ncbi:MAG: head GIN domain-containing protein [Flavitalea sp.]
MKKQLAIFSLLFTMATANAQKQVINDANAQQRDLKGFHAIKVSHAFDVYISQGDEEGVVVSAKTKEFRDLITTSVENGVLKIGYGERGWKGSGNRQLKVYISVKELDQLNASGACDLVITGTLKAKDLMVDLSGASDLKGNIEAEFLNAEISGASDVTISGKVDGLKIEANGASDFKGYDLIAEKCEAKASGASDIKITVNKELNAEASGASGVSYKGAGVIRDIKSSGASSISKKD